MKPHDRVSLGGAVAVIQRVDVGAVCIVMPDGSTRYVAPTALTPLPWTCSREEALAFVDRVRGTGESVAVPMRVLLALADAARGAK